MMNWTIKRLNDTFATLNEKFWGGRLSGWRVDDSMKSPGAYGCCNPKTKHISIKLSPHYKMKGHRPDHEIRATLVHEMAHAATNLDHGARWRREIQRLRSAGAPTNELDFLVPYDLRNVVTDFIDAACGGACWEEALGYLGEMHELIDPTGDPVDARANHVLTKCRTFFERQRRRTFNGE